ncbi:hypothetical protein EVA_07888, partial [gut metagenome]
MPDNFFLYPTKDVFSHRHQKGIIHMKKTSLIGFLLLILTACGSNEENSTTLSGTIQGLGKDTLYL